MPRKGHFFILITKKGGGRMNYVMLVSHGEFAYGLRNAVCMLAGGDREDVIAIGLKDGMGSDDFAVELKKVIPTLGDEDQLLIFADIVGGSPLTTTANVVSELGILSKTTMIGGMNLPMVLTTVMSKDFMDLEDVKKDAMDGGIEQIREFAVAVDDEEEDL
jgi:PTS system N-acetylgalactosamine-specific IIA component